MLAFSFACVRLLFRDFRNRREHFRELAWICEADVHEHALDFSQYFKTSCHALPVLGLSVRLSEPESHSGNSLLPVLLRSAVREMEFLLAGLFSLRLIHLLFLQMVYYPLIGCLFFVNTSIV